MQLSITYSNDFLLHFATKKRLDENQWDKSVCRYKFHSLLRLWPQEIDKMLEFVSIFNAKKERDSLSISINWIWMQIWRCIGATKRSRHYSFGPICSRAPNCHSNRSSCNRDLCKCCQQRAIHTIYDCINAVISCYLSIVSHAHNKSEEQRRKEAKRANEAVRHMCRVTEKIGVLMVKR